MTSRPTRVLLVVLDGLRPDMVGPKTTPNLAALANDGTRFSRARSVFPSETRVASASVATGCHPRRHGLVANRFAVPGSVLDTGQVAQLRAFVASGGALLDVPTIGDVLAGHGETCTIVSSGSTGHSFVLNPNVEANGQITVSAHGAAYGSRSGRTLTATVASPPSVPIQRAEWAAGVVIERVLPDPPALTILWLCEPDHSAHYEGLGAPKQMAALFRADAALGRVLDAWRAGPHRDRLQVIVASDHGHAKITGLVDVASHLATLGAAKGVAYVAGASCGLAVPVGGPGRVAEVATWLLRQPWCGQVFATDDAAPPGALPRSLLLADHTRQASVVFTLRGDGQTTLFDGALDVGAGIHGGLSTAELSTVLVLAGSRMRTGVVVDRPVGLLDLAPTILHLLKLSGGEAMDGRVMTEALTGGAASPDSSETETFEATSGGSVQRLTRLRAGRHVWLNEGHRSSR